MTPSRRIALIASGLVAVGVLALVVVVVSRSGSGDAEGDEPAPTAWAVGPEGGTYDFGDLTVVVPPGTAAEGTRLDAVEAEAAGPTVDGVVAAGPAFRLEVTEGALDGRIRVTVPVEGTHGRNEMVLAAVRVDADEDEQYVAGGQVEDDRLRVRVPAPLLVQAVTWRPVPAVNAAFRDLLGAGAPAAGPPEGCAAIEDTTVEPGPSARPLGSCAFERSGDEIAIRLQNRGRNSLAVQVPEGWQGLAEGGEVFTAATLPAASFGRVLVPAGGRAGVRGTVAPQSEATVTARADTGTQIFDSVLAGLLLAHRLDGSADGGGPAAAGLADIETAGPAADCLWALMSDSADRDAVRLLPQSLACAAEVAAGAGVGDPASSLVDQFADSLGRPGQTLPGVAALLSRPTTAAVAITNTAPPPLPAPCTAGDPGDVLAFVQQEVECLAELYQAGDSTEAEFRFGSVATELFAIGATGALTGVDCYPNNLCAVRWTDTCATVFWSLGEAPLSSATIGCSDGVD